MLRPLAARVCPLLAGVLALGASSAARAADRSASEASLAKDMLKEAIEDEKAGKCEDAIEVLKQVIAIQETSEAYLHLGTCIVRSGKLRDGLRTLEKAEDLARKEKDRAVQQTLVSRINDLRDRLPTITIHLPEDARDASVKIDGQPVGAADLARPLPVDPGEHVVEAHAAGRDPFSQKLKLAEKDTPLVEVVLAPPGSGAGGNEGATSTIPLGTWIAGTAAVALAAGGIIAFAVAGSTASNGRETCATQPSCDPTTVGAVRQLDAAALGMWIGAGVGAGAAVTLYLWENRSKRPQKGSRSPVLLAGLGSIGLRGEF